MGAVRCETSPGMSGNAHWVQEGGKNLEQPASRVPWAALELQSQMPKLGLKLPIRSAEDPRCGEKHQN